jgi:cytochrome c biogenesis protein CcmG/thiol:disulfide interchange protein DsbE
MQPARHRGNKPGTLVRRTFIIMEGSETSQLEETGRRRSPAWMAAGAVALVVVALLGYGLVSKPLAPPQIGSPVPDFQLTAFDGSPMKLSSHRGQVVVVNFFSSWCEPCREEAAALQQTWQDYQGSSVQFFGIAYKDAASKAQTFLNEFDVTYPSTAEPGSRTARKYGVTGVPETFVIDQQGKLVRHYLGAITKAQLSQEVSQLLGP